MEMGIPLCIALNMMDVAHHRGIHIDVERLSQLLGVPVIPTQAVRHVGIGDLKAAIHRTAESIEVAEVLQRKGKALYSKARREKGVCVVGGGVIDAEDWGLALHQNGAITLHGMQALLQSGTIPVEGEIMAFVTFPNPENAKEQI